MNKQQITRIIIVVALVAGVLGYVIGAGSSGRMSFLGGFGAGNLPSMPDSNSISGGVKSIQGNIITLSTPSGNPRDEAPKERQVTVTSATEITKLENKSAETIKKEQEDYGKKMASWKPGSGVPPVQPSLSVEKKISVSDIKAGDLVNVLAAILIRLEEKFEATKITVVSSAAALPPAPAPAR